MKELIEAAEKYRRDTCNEACKQGFLDNNPSPSVKSAFIAGGEWMREQMLKDAWERKVKIDSGGYPYIDITAELYDYEHNAPLAKEGELVKIIIVKEE